MQFGDCCALDIHAAIRAYIRSNNDTEGVMRISPQQVHFPVGARLRFPVERDLEWGLFAFHQSNHDVDESDALQNAETVAYEIYGADLAAPGWRVAAGIYYDRGTRIESEDPPRIDRQTLPFDYYLAGVQGEWAQPLHDPLYGAGRLELVGHLGGDHSPPHLNIAGEAEVGVFFAGDAGAWRVFLRFERVEDYQKLEDDPRHMALLGVGLGPLGWAAPAPEDPPKAGSAAEPR